MKYLSLCLTLFFAHSLFAKPLKPLVVYGEDNRRDLFEITSSLYHKLAESTAGMVDNIILKKSKCGQTYKIEGSYTLEEGLKVCKGERFIDQPMLASCSGFLVGPDLLVTASHCYFDMEEDLCHTSTWVFGLKMQNAHYMNLSSISKDDVYRCKEVLKMRMDDEFDYAIVRLDREVVGRAPLKFRTEGKVSSEAELVAIGHPSMLPTKITDQGKILKNDNPNYFDTNLDTFQGNSGSAVFDAKTGLLEGILIGGKTDYIPSKQDDYGSCQMVNVCDETGQNCLAQDNLTLFSRGERVIRISAIADIIKEFLE